MKQQDCRCLQSYYNKKSHLKLQSDTTNKLHYKAYQLEKPINIAPPKIVQKHYDPSVLQSSYKSTYIKPVGGAGQNQVNNSDLINSYMKSKPKNVPFSSETQYNKSYLKNDIKAQPVPKYQYKPKNTKFQGQSSYKQQYTKPNVNNNFYKSNDSGLIQSYTSKKQKIPFQGKSAYKDSFVNHEIKPERQPQYKYQPKNTKFQGQSSYKQQFAKPNVNNTHNKSNDAGFIQDYLSKKPKIAFQGKSAYKDSFVSHDVKPERQPQYKYQPKNTKFEGQSSYKSQFQKPNVNNFMNKSNDSALIQDYMSKKPKIAFQGKSSYKDSFVNHQVKPERQPDYKYQPKNTKFQGQSSYKSTFKQMPKEVYKNHNEYCPVHPDKVAVI